jgi:23S rRNA (guanosine2251-2'-O)-methyltransferase
MAKRTGPGARRHESRPSPSNDRRAPRGLERIGGDQIEGVHAVYELLKVGRREVRELFVADSRADSEALGGILALAEEARVPVRLVDSEELLRRAYSEAPQGVIARAEQLVATSLESLLASASPLFLVVLDEITDPQNFGAVMRSALGAGAGGVVIGRQRAVRVTASVAKAAAGAVEHLPIAMVAGIPAALRELSRSGVWNVGLDGEGPAVLDEVALLSEPLALVLGAEGRGLSPLVAQRCDVLARIPLLGPVESLNASAAAAVACFEVARHRRTART